MDERSLSDHQKPLAGWCSVISSASSRGPFRNPSVQVRRTWAAGPMKVKARKALGMPKKVEVPQVHGRTPVARARGGPTETLLFSRQGLRRRIRYLGSETQRGVGISVVDQSCEVETQHGPSPARDSLTKTQKRPVPFVTDLARTGQTTQVERNMCQW